MNPRDSSGVKFIPSFKKKKNSERARDDEASFPGKMLNLGALFWQAHTFMFPKYLLNNLWAQQGQSCEVYVFRMMSWGLQEKDN